MATSVMRIDELTRTQNLDYPEKMETKDYLVAFSGLSKSYCIGFVDMENSTRISANLHEREWCKYYSHFLNTMAIIMKRFGGEPIKNGGDSILYYFPESAKTDKKYGFISCLECNLAMVEAHDQISEKLVNEGLPSINYRVSSDFGRVVIMQPNCLSPMDIIGPPVNMCAKINNSAKRNGIVIGGDLYQMVKDLEDYNFKPIQGISIGLKYTYPIYCVQRKD